MARFKLVVFIACLIPCVELSALPTGAILVSNNYTRCKDLNLHTQKLMCEIHSQEDEMTIERFGLSGCYGSTLTCTEGDIKTCMPLMTLNNLHFQCYCHLEEKGIIIASDYYWSAWKKLTRHFRGFFYRCRLSIYELAVI